MCVLALENKCSGFKMIKTAKKKMKKHEKNVRKLLILLENGHKGVHIVKNGSSQRKKDYKLLKVARYV